MKSFRNASSLPPQTVTVLAGLVLAGASITAWQARAALPRWMQDAVGSSAIEAALYRMMEIPGVKALYPRPPKEAQGELSGLIAKAPGQADLYSLRAMEEEQALDFTAAEGDWKAYAARSKDAVSAKLELADYYHRRLQANDEVAMLMEVGSASPQPSEQYIAAPEQQSWKAFERLMTLAADQGLDQAVYSHAYAAWIARYPQQPSLYAREFRWLLDQSDDAKRLDNAADLIALYRRAFPKDAIFPLKATALLELRRGSIDQALATYNAGFQPLWPAELVQSYYALLAETHRQRGFIADARAHLAQNPDDLNAMARLFYYSQQQGNLPAAQQVVEAYRLSKEARKANWSAQELYTLATLTEAIQAYPEAARYNFALYHAQGALASGASPQAEGLSGIIRILLTAPDQPVELGAGNLSMYRDIATLDQGPGYWNGILSLWLNSESPDQSYHEEEQRAQPYFHRAKAAELLTTLDKNYPKASERAELHQQLIHVFADYGESALVVQSGNEFLTGFQAPEDETNRVVVAMYMADAYARLQDTKDEFALYDRMLTELGGVTAGMPLTAASASNRGPVNPPETSQPTDQDGQPSDASDVAAAAMKAEKSRAFEVSAGSPTGVFVAGSQEYQQLLERYLGRLTATGQLPQALAVLRKELDRNPNDPLLYERLANFLQQNNLSAQQEDVYNEAIRKFQDKGWYDKLARLYLREKKREAFADLTKQVTSIFSGTELESYFSTVNQGGTQLYLQLNLYAHQRFPHDEVFIRNLLSAYRTRGTEDSAAWEKLLREHWSDSDQFRQEFFGYLSSHGKLDAELTQLHTLVPTVQELKANPAATRELAEVELWRSHYEQSAPLFSSLAAAYPADAEIGTQASSVFRSLAYYDSQKTERAVAIEKHLLAANPADTDRLARIGDIYADSGADSTTGHENIAAAAPYWQRMTTIHPGTPDGYLQAATIFWDYYQFDEALREINEARNKFHQPALYGYEAGAIYEGERDMASAIREYTSAAINGSANSEAAGRLLQLARRKATAKMVDSETSKAMEGGSIGALQLRERVLDVQKRLAELGPLLEAQLAKATDFDEVQLIATEAQSHTLPRLYELALQREIALASDPVQKIEISYELVRSYEGRKDTEAAARLIDQVYRENPKLMGVVRATADFYWRTKQPVRSIDTLLEASKASQQAQPTLSRQFLVEAADKANASGSYAQARTLMAPLIDASKPGVSVDEAYNAQYLGVVADSYARAGDDAGLKQFYLDKLSAIRSVSMAADSRKQKIVLLRRGLIPALTRMKDYAGAVDQYIAILSAYPEDAGTVQEAALYALRYSRQAQLLDFVGTTVKASPRDSRFAIMQAQMDTTLEDYPSAVDAYARAIAIRSDRSDLYAAKADLEERLQRVDDACKEYERLYVLSYKDPEWMLKIATVRARQGRNEDAVKALQRAWIEGHPATAQDYFRVATQLESWKMLDESLRFAELGVKAEGDALLAGSEPGDRNADDPEGATLYTRLLTRKRQVQKALTVLDAAREDANRSPNSPSLIVEQAEKQGLASVTNADWRKRRIEERHLTAEGRYHGALVEMGKTVANYFTPEEKQQFAGLVDKRAAMPSPSLLWIDVATSAGIAEEEARLRRQKLLDPKDLSIEKLSPQYEPYLQLQRSRMAFTELAQTLEAYAAIEQPQNRVLAWVDEAAAYRSAGDEVAELHVLDKIDFAANQDGGERERYLQLLLKHDVARFESFGASNDNEEIAFHAPNYAAEHSDIKIARAALSTHAKAFPGAWQNAYSALLGLYFRDRSATTETAFHSILGDRQTIGERIRSHSSSSEDDDSASAQLAGNVWFYYGMRYGVYRTLAPAKSWPQSDPEDFLAAGLERNASAANYIALARSYADAGKPESALIEYRHALELAHDSAAVHDAMAILLWKSGKKDEAIAEWRGALTALNRIQNKGAAPESFWSSFALIAQHLGSRKITSQLHPEMDTVLRNYLQHNADYRSEELLHAAFDACATHSEGLEWIVALSATVREPGSILSQVDNAPWLPVEARETILLREVELARIAASHPDKDNDYTAQRLLQLQKTLVTYYVAQKQDAKAQAILDSFTESQRDDAEIFAAQIELAARAHKLDALLASYGSGADEDLPATRLQMLHSAAATFATEDDKASALMIWEFVFERGQLRHSLSASDYMGLAEARLVTGNLTGAIELLRRMTQMPAVASNDGADAGSDMANYDHAATLLLEKGHAAEAIEFLAAMVKGVPWNASYRFRLAQAQLSAGQSKADAVASLASLASDNSLSYPLRVNAAVAMQGNADTATKLGGGELQLLAAGKIAPQQAQQPYYVAARISAADAIAEPAPRAAILREAIAIAPAAVNGAAGFNRSDLQLRLLRAEAQVGHDTTAVGLIQPLLNSANAAAEDASANTDDAASAGDADESADAAEPDTETPDGPVTSSVESETLATLESAAPLPLQGKGSDAEKIALATLIAQVYERTGSLANALPYLKLAAYLQKDAGPHAEVQRHVEQLQTTLALEAQNAQRRPTIQKALNQSSVVRAKLTAAELAQQEAH